MEVLKSIKIVQDRRGEGRHIARLTTAENVINAALIQHKLDAEGISSFITSEHTSTLLPHMNGMLGIGIQVMVDERDLQKAGEILLRDKEDSQINSCPYCGSEDIGYGIGGKKKTKNLINIVLSVFSGTPVNHVKSRYYCRHCKEDFGT
jgi:hypothetical protein